MNDLKQIEDYYKVSNQIDWDKIIDDYTPYINTIINNMANSLSYEDKEEILLDTFFMLWKNQDNILYSLKAYIVGITKNLIKEKLRKRHITYNISDYEEMISRKYELFDSINVPEDCEEFVLRQKFFDDYENVIEYIRNKKQEILDYAKNLELIVDISWK